MLLGAVFEREVAFAPRARGLYVARAVYVAALLAILATCWLVVTGSQSVTTAGDTARFGATLVRILAPLQLTLAMLAAALTGVVAVSTEKDRRTLELLLVSRLTDRELVFGKLAASLVRVLLLLLAAVPLFAITGLFGGITAAQLTRIFVVTVAAALASASIATTVAFWKDTTFQSLAITLFALVAWVAGVGVRLVIDGFRFDVSRALPDRSRVAPWAGLKRVLSPATAGRALAGMLFLALPVLLAVRDAPSLLAKVSAPLATASLSGPPGALVAHVGVAIPAAVGALLPAVGVAVAAALVRHVLRRRFAERRLRMTPEELREELRDLTAPGAVKWSRPAAPRRSPADQPVGGAA